MEPYQITSSLFGIVAQRLLRRRTAGGYAGRIPVAEFVAMGPELRQAILARADADGLAAMIAARPGHVSLRAAGESMAGRGVTDSAEVARILGTG